MTGRRASLTGPRPRSIKLLTLADGLSCEAGCGLCLLTETGWLLGAEMQCQIWALRHAGSRRLQVVERGPAHLGWNSVT